MTTTRRNPTPASPMRTPSASSLRTRRRLTSAVAAVALLAAACGDDEQDGAASDITTEIGGEATTTTEATDETTTTDSGDSGGATDTAIGAFCSGVIEGGALFAAGPELDEAGNPTPEGLEQFSQQLEPALADVEENAPEELSSQVETVVGAVRSAIEQGDPSGTETVEFLEADTAIDQYVYDNCELDATQEIVGVEYEFQGLGETIASGQTGIRLDNQGQEVHEAIIMRINDDVTLGVQELLELPEEEAQQMVEFTGATIAGPGEAGATVLDLEPGRYAVLCFVPVGTTSIDDLESQAAQEGPPHISQGMVAEFRVE